MIIKIAGGKDSKGNVLWKHVYSDAIRNRLRRDQNLADIPDINEARKNLGIEHVSDSIIESLVSDLESYVLTKINELRVELNSYRMNHTDVDITALDSRLTALANKVTSLTMSDVDERFNILWDSAKREIQNYILQLFGESDGVLPDFPSDFSTLHWCGTMSDFPTQPKAGWFVIIHNSTTDNLAYVYTGSSWVLLSCNCSDDSGGDNPPSGSDPPSGGDPPSGDDTISGGGGDDPPSGDDPPPDDGGTSTPSNPVDPFKPTGDPEGEDQQYTYEYIFKLEENHSSLGYNIFTGPTATTPRTYRFGLDEDDTAVLFLPAEFAISGNDCAISQKLLPPETVANDTKQPIELGARLVAHSADNNLIKFTITASDLEVIKNSWEINSIVGSLLVLVYDYTGDSNDKTVNHVRFIPQEVEDNTTSWSLFRTSSDGSVAKLKTSIKVPVSVHLNSTTKYWLSDYMPIVADSEVNDTATSCAYLQGFRLKYSNNTTQVISEMYRASAPLAYFAAALWQTVETVDNTNPTPPSPEPGDHYDNANNYDSAFPYLTDLIGMIKSKSNEQTNIESVNKWLLDFKLEAEDENLKMGRKAYTVEYKQRNHYVSGHFAMHGNNAVLYLPSDYFNSAYLKNVYIASEDETYCTIYAASSYESREKTIFGTKNQLYPLNVKLSDNVPALVMNKTYTDMPPDTDYGVVLIPAETLSRIRVSTRYPDDTVKSLSLVDTLKLVLEYNFNNAVTGKSDNKKVGCINFRLLQSSSFNELTSNKKAGLKPYFTQQENIVSDNYVTLDKFMDTVQVMFSYLSPSYYDFVQFVGVNSKEYTAASLYRFELMMSSLRKESSHTPLSYEHYTSDTYAISSAQFVTSDNKRFKVGNDAVSNYGFIFSYKYPKDNVFVVTTTVQEDSVNVWGQPEEPDTPSKPDYSDNASYDSSFPDLSSILNNGLSKKKWLLDFPLENHSDNLLKGKKSFIREYKQRNHYISGHFVKHNGNAVIYLPEGYFNSSLLKAVYLAPPPNQHLTICTEGNFELDVQKTKTFKDNQLVPLDSDEYPLLVSNRSYTDMPPDTGYGVIVIPKSTLHCIQCDWNGTIDDTGLDEYDGLHLVLEYQLNIMPAGASADGTYGYMRFLPVNNAASTDTDIEFVSDKRISSENYWLLPDNTTQSNTIITIPELPANTIAHYHNFIYRYEYTFNPGIYVSGSGTASDSGTVLTYNGNLAIQGDIRFAKSSNITYWTGNARAGNPNNISGKLKPYFELQYPTDNVIIFITTIDLAK